MLARIDKLLQLAANNPSGHEAASAALKAAKLIADHKVRLTTQPEIPPDFSSIVSEILKTKPTPSQRQPVIVDKGPVFEAEVGRRVREQLTWYQAQERVEKMAVMTDIANLHQRLRDAQKQENEWSVKYLKLLQEREQQPRGLWSYIWHYLTS